MFKVKKQVSLVNVSSKEAPLLLFAYTYQTPRIGLIGSVVVIFVDQLEMDESQ